jgi:hypothetical protein
MQTASACLLCRVVIPLSVWGLLTARMHAWTSGTWWRCRCPFTGIATKRAMRLSLTGTGLVSTVLGIVNRGPWRWRHGRTGSGVLFHEPHTVSLR